MCGHDHGEEDKIFSELLESSIYIQKEEEDVVFFWGKLEENLND